MGYGKLQFLNVYPMNGPSAVQRQEAIQQHAYQRSLEDGVEPPQLTPQSVRYWSDFNRIYFHPRSIVQLNDYDLNSRVMPFERWDVGKELFDSLDKEHELLDRDLRFFAEEADQMQGIQVIAGIDDAWGGFASSYIDRLRDEYGKTTIWCWGVEDSLEGTPVQKQILKQSNTARCLSEISSQTSLFLPITLPSRLPSYVSLDPKSQWHVSGLLSTAVESVTLPSRFKPQQGLRQTLDDMINALNINGNQNIAKLRMSVHHNPPSQIKLENGSDTASQGLDPRIHHGNESEVEDDQESEDPNIFDMELFPTYSQGRRSFRRTHVFGQAENYRGVEYEQDSKISDVDEGLRRARRRAAGQPMISRTLTALSFPLLDSFPPIYSQAPSGTSSNVISVCTSLTTDTSVSYRLKSLQNVVNRAISVDEREALNNSLAVIAEAYEEGWDSGSDEDDD
ncbi:tubulin domain-containing protein [Xylogone sp. PMI_703]|nr:tubulin domain-containing protein [Xylogone sp. PMI_703]